MKWKFGIESNRTVDKQIVRPCGAIRRPHRFTFMTATIGVDIHSVADTEHSLAHFGSTFSRRLFSDEEVEFASSHPVGASRFLAERFAAREAILKLLDFSDPFVHWRQVSLRTVTRSKCIVILKGKCEERASELGLNRIHLTMSSTRHIAMAVAFADYNGTQD